MFIANNASKLKTTGLLAAYLVGNLAMLTCGWLGHQQHNIWGLIAFYTIVVGDMLMAVLYGICVLWCLPEDKYKVALGIASRGKYRWNWLEMLFNGLVIGIMLWNLHYIIGALYLAGAIINARIRWEVRFVSRPLAEIQYEFNNTGHED